MLGLSSSKFVHTREVEKFVDVLGDIGGFNDIVTIFFAIMMSRYSQIMFEGRLVKGTKVEEESRQKKRNSSTAAYLRVMQQKLQADQDATINRLELKELLLQFKRITRLKVPVFGYLCCPCFYSHTKKRKLQKKVLDRSEKALDIRSITKTKLDLKILVDILLTFKQKKLFKYQRKRLT